VGDTLTVRMGNISKRTYNNLLNQNKIHITDIDNNKLKLVNKNYLETSNVLSSSMIDDLFENYSLDYINKHYGDLTYHDKKNIIKRVKENDVQKSISTSFLRDELKEFLTEYDELNIEGFMKFRADEVKKIIRKTNESAIDSYIIEKEYDNFIFALKKFISKHEPIEKELYVYINKEQGVIYKNKENEDITKRIIREWDSQDIRKLMTQDDIFISVLITIAPKKLYIYGIDNLKNKELAQTIKKIWGKRLVCYSTNT